MLPPAFVRDLGFPIPNTYIIILLLGCFNGAVAVRLGEFIRNRPTIGRLWSSVPAKLNKNLIKDNALNGVSSGGRGVFCCLFLFLERRDVVGSEGTGAVVFHSTLVLCCCCCRRRRSYTARLSCRRTERDHNTTATRSRQRCQAHRDRDTRPSVSPDGGAVSSILCLRARGGRSPWISVRWTSSHYRGRRMKTSSRLSCRAKERCALGYELPPGRLRLRTAEAEERSSGSREC